MSYRIEYKLKNETWVERQRKYPGFYQTNDWRYYDKFNDESKRNKAFEKIGESAEFLFRTVDPEPEIIEVEDEKAQGEDT